MLQWMKLKSSIALCTVLFASSSLGAEVRTYSFTGELPAYSFSCGECSGPPYWVRGKVDGNFTVDLDFDDGVGTLQLLNARLSDVEGNFGPNNWQSIAWGDEFLESSSYYDHYRPPYTGTLMPAAYRPLGPATLTAEHLMPYIGVPTSQIPTEVNWWLFQGVGFEPAPADAWVLYFNGLVPEPDGLTYSVGASFLIYFEQDRAQFSYYIPILDAVPSITAASAKLVPEPTSIALTSFMLYWLCGRCNRIALTSRLKSPGASCFSEYSRKPCSR